jgi:hypothetical protein
MPRASGSKKITDAKPKDRGVARSKAADGAERLTIDGHEVAISNPQKVLFPGPKYTKLDLVNYYLAVAGALEAPVAVRTYSCDIRTGSARSSSIRNGPPSHDRIGLKSLP